MGLNLFGSSKGDSSTTNDYRQDNSTIEGDLSEGAIRADGNATVNVTDGGAFDLVGSVVGDSLGMVEGAVDDVLGYSAQTTDNAFGFVNSFVGQMVDANERAMNTVLESSASALGTVERLNESEAATTGRSMEKIGLVLVAGLVITFVMTARK